jgi:putative PIN family toxin of toxin-antitoxin system
VRRVTADSNVLVSALVFGGKPLTILEMAQAGEIELAISEPIINETLRIIRDKFYRSREQVTEMDGHLRAISHVVTPVERIDAVPDDEDDNKILECAIAAGSDVIVSGDAHLLRLNTFRNIKIRRPADFLAAFQARAR